MLATVNAKLAHVQDPVASRLSRGARVRTGESLDSLEVARGAGLQKDRDGALSVRPGKLERLARLGVDDGVGELGGLRSGREGGDDEGGGSLHCENM
jgi:hypothetical protein